MIANMLRALLLLRFPETRTIIGEQILRQRQTNHIRAEMPACKISSTVEWIGYGAGRLTLGEGSTISHGTVLAFGDDIAGFGRIDIGSGTWIGQYNNIRASRDADISIGKKCLIAQFCTLSASNHSTMRGHDIQDQGNNTERLGIVIGDDVWLGAGVVVLAGVHIGRGAVIGANSVVTRHVPEYEIWAGVAARRIGARAE